jgi:hypothetical protein
MALQRSKRHYLFFLWGSEELRWSRGELMIRCLPSKGMEGMAWDMMDMYMDWME